MPRTRTPEQRESDLAFIARLYCRNVPQTKIREALAEEYKRIGLDIVVPSLPNMSYDIQEIHKRWVNSSLVSFNELKAKELAKLDSLENAYWEGYERAIQTKIETRDSEEIEDSDKPSKKTIRLTKKEEDLLTGKYWLDGIKDCITARCKVLGLFEPDKFQVDWRTEALASGMKQETIDASFEKMVQAAYLELQSNPKFAEPIERTENETG